MRTIPGTDLFTCNMHTNNYRDVGECWSSTAQSAVSLIRQLELGKLRTGRNWQQGGLDAQCLVVNMQQEALGLQMSCRVECPGDWFANPM